MFKFFKKAKEKANEVLDITKEKVTIIADSADKFISDGNNQIKTITVIVIIAGISMTLSNIVNIGVNVCNAKHIKEPKIVNNIYYTGGQNAKKQS